MSSVFCWPVHQQEDQSVETWVQPLAKALGYPPSDKCPTQPSMFCHLSSWKDSSSFLTLTTRATCVLGMCWWIDIGLGPGLHANLHHISWAGNGWRHTTWRSNMMICLTRAYHGRTTINVICRGVLARLTLQRDSFSKVECYPQELHTEAWARLTLQEERDTPEASLCLCSTGHTWNIFM